MGLVGVVGLWAIAIALPAVADYQPPDNASAPSGSTSSSGARRGCLADDGSLLILAPHSHVGHTASTRPSVSWFIPDTEPFDMELHLYQLTATDELTLLDKQVMETTPGIMQASLSEGQPDLVPGEHYLWRVVVLCNPNRPSSALVDEVEMVVVPAPVELESAMAASASPHEQAAAYAQAGLWYDAFAQVAEAENPDDVAYRQQLLVSLGEIEASAPAANSTFGEELQELALP